MCSSWYFLRFANATYAAAAFDPKKLKYWLPVDLYTGGAEHAVMHLFYARFFIKALRDMGLIDFSEPFTRLFNQGVITANHQKMSKSRGNVISPDKYVSTLGADTFRAYLMFIGPWEQGGDWSDTGISGMSRWLNRVWNLALDGYTAGTADGHAREQALTELRRVTHQTIRKVGGDIERFRFNTMIAALMESTNFLSRVKETGAVSEADWREAIDSLLLLLAPPVPHIADELWERTGHEGSIHSQSWPEWDKELARDEEVTLIVQVNGRLRDRIVVPAIIGEDEARRLAAGSTKVKAHTDGKQLVKAIYVPGKLVNLVVK